MDDSKTRRWVLRHGAIVLLIALSLGFLLIPPVSNARSWLGTHVTAILVSLLTLVTGLLWPDLNLGARARRLLAWIAVLSGYVGLVGGSVASIFGIPGPVTGGGVQPDPAKFALLIPFLAFLTIGGLTWAGLLVRGLSGTQESVH